MKTSATVEQGKNSRLTEQTNPKNMDTKLTKCSWVIHLFAIAHTISVVLFDRLGYSDEVILSLLTISMIVVVTHLYGMPLEVSAAVAALCCFAGFYLGTIGGEWLDASGVPLLVEYANALTTFVVTELLGWLTVIVARKR